MREPSVRFALPRATSAPVLPPHRRKACPGDGGGVCSRNLKASDYFQLPASLAGFSAHFRSNAAPWEWVRSIAAALAAITEEPARREVSPGVLIEGRVWLHPTVKLPAHATLLGPAWIGPRTEIRPGAFVRGNVIVGEGCVLGNACEFKNCLLMDAVQVPHFSYVGDSVLGNGAHLGAGAICSNLRLDQAEVNIRAGDTLIPTGLRKLGAILGDRAEVGCNAVLNPGTILGRRALVMPCSAFGGVVPEGHIVRVRSAVTFVARREDG